MDRECWPDDIAKFVDGVACPQCAAPRSRVLVTVRYQVPVWRIFSNCVDCKTTHEWQHIDMFGTLKPKARPEPEPVATSTPLPDWVKELR